MTAAATIGLMRQRMGAVPAAVVETLQREFDGAAMSGRVVVTGLGSSQWAARLLAGLLTRAGGMEAFFVGMSEFFRGSHPVGETLVVFSQGLSANARLALAHRHQFKKCVVVTSVSGEGLQAAGKQEVLRLWETLRGEGAVILRHPLEDEYTLLPRFVGPACALAWAMVMGGHGGRGREIAPAPAVLRRGLTAAAEEAERVLAWGEDFALLPEWNFIGPGVEYGGNLQAKVMECLFVRLPAPRDLLEFAHGGFQANCHSPAPQWIFSEASPADDDLLGKVYPLFNDNPYPLRVIRSPWAFPLNLLYYEIFLNRLLLAEVERLGLDLIDWPGKGMDGAGYSLAAPYAGPVAGD